MNSSGSVTAVNTFGPSGLLYRKVIGGTEIFYTFDPGGNVVQRLDGSGNILSSHVFDAYGVSSSTVSTTSDPFSGYGGQWGYVTDWETGLQLCGHRYYDAASGRWINRDPIGYDGGINLYGYVGNNPINSIDPRGTFIWIIAIGIGLFLISELPAGEPNPNYPRTPLQQFVNDNWTPHPCCYAATTNPPLRRIHSDDTITKSNSGGYRYWRQKSTDDIIRSLRPGSEDPLRTFPDGRIKDGNTRIKILEERGCSEEFLNNLPREVEPPQIEFPEFPIEE